MSNATKLLVLIALLVFFYIGINFKASFVDLPEFGAKKTVRQPMVTPGEPTTTPIEDWDKYIIKDKEVVTSRTIKSQKLGIMVDIPLNWSATTNAFGPLVMYPAGSKDKIVMTLFSQRFSAEPTVAPCVYPYRPFQTRGFLGRYSEDMEYETEGCRPRIPACENGAVTVFYHFPVEKGTLQVKSCKRMDFESVLKNLRPLE